MATDPPPLPKKSDEKSPAAPPTPAEPPTPAPPKVEEKPATPPPKTEEAPASPPEKRDGKPATPAAQRPTDARKSRATRAIPKPRRASRAPVPTTPAETLTPPTSSRPPSASLESALVRPTLILLVLLALTGGAALPGLVTGFAQTVTPGSANGSILTHPNGTAYGSSLLGQNITDPALFWPRPSLTDYQAFTGAGGEVPYGPTDPALVNWTLYYIARDGLTNATVPLDAVSLSASGLDPDISPAAALIQIPRVSAHSNLTESFLLSFVNSHVEGPLGGFLGPQFVNVLELDVDLLSLEGR
jgi:potassium-transporting ATPase KdpC subunit